MTNIFLAGLGGFVGAALRYSVGLLALRLQVAPAFVMGTLLVNVVGCFAIGLLGGISELRGPFTAEVRALVVGGVLGGFTTYSTFAFETVNLVKTGERALAGWNVGLHLVLGLTAVWLGHVLGRTLGQTA